MIKIQIIREVNQFFDYIVLKNTKINTIFFLLFIYAI